MIGINASVDVKQLLPLAVRTATYNGPDIDFSQHIGLVKAILEAEAQGSGITLNVKLQESDLSAFGNSYQVAEDTDKKLNIATSGKTKLGVQWTQTSTRSVKRVSLRLKKAGTIEATKILTLTIEANSGGDPSGTPLGTAVTVLANSIGDAYEWVDFVFTVPVNLSASTVYHLVLTSNYDASDTNYIAWGGVTLGSGGNAEHYEPASWADVTTLSLLFCVYQYSFADVSGLVFTEVGNVAAIESIHFDISAVKRIVRAVATVAGGSATGASCLHVLVTKRFA